MSNPADIKSNAAPDGGAEETPAATEPTTTPETTTAATPAAPSVEANTPAPSPAAAPKVGRLEAIMGMAKSRGAMMQESAAFQQRAETAEGDLATMTTAYAELEAVNQSLIAERDAIDKALAQSETKAQTVSASAVEQIAALGMPLASLPEVAEGNSEDQVEALEAQMAASTDAAEKGKLAKQIRDLESAG